jgi:hypothetical protein
MRALGQATGAYYNDWKIDPNVDNVIVSEPNRSRIWWGYASHRLTTPTAYIKTIPVDPFPDADPTNNLVWGWTGINSRNGNHNRPYLVVVRVRTTTPQAELWHFRPFGNSAFPNIGGMDPLSWQQLGGAPWVYFSAGPDLSATLTYLGVGGKVFATYNPTNGTQSKGDMWVGGY